MIDSLIAWIESKGATVRKTYDSKALINEGRYVLQSIRIIGLRGIWPLSLDVDEGIEYIRHLQGLGEGRRYEVYHV